MKVALRLLYIVLMFSILFTYNIVLSSAFFFVPRIFRKKKNIKGQRVLITGAGSGVGRELAIEFSKHATTLILVDINRQSLLQTEKLLDRCSPVFIYDCDVSDYKKVKEMAKQVQKDAGDVDILVNNAGVVNGKFLWDLPEDKIVKTMEVNALAHFWTCKAFLPAMMEQNRGHIISIISLVGKCGMPQLTDYCASKYAALGFAESLEMELRHRNLNGIKITTVCPAFMDTNLFKGFYVKYIPTLSAAYVAKEVVAGVLENKEMIILPRFLSPITILKESLPRWIVVRMQDMLGHLNAMDNFVGNGLSENRKDVKNKTKKKE